MHYMKASLTLSVKLTLVKFAGSNSKMTNSGNDITQLAAQVSISIKSVRSKVLLNDNGLQIAYQRSTDIHVNVITETDIETV